MFEGKGEEEKLKEKNKKNLLKMRKDEKLRQTQKKYSELEERWSKKEIRLARKNRHWSVQAREQQRCHFCGRS